MGEFFGELRGHISPYGLNLLWKQWQILRGEDSRIATGEVNSICTGNYWRSTGVRCWYMIKERLDDLGRIQPLDFHPHWHWQKPLPGAEPIPIRTPTLDAESRQRRRAEEVA